MTKNEAQIYRKQINKDWIYSHADVIEDNDELIMENNGYMCDPKD